MKRRNVVAVLVLSYLTLGIYTIYWLYRTRLDLLQHTADKNAIPRVITMFIPFFATVGSFILLLLLTSILADGGNPGTALTIVSAILVVLIIVGILTMIIISFWWLYRYFQTLEQIVQGTDAMLYYTIWIALTLFGIGPVWVLLVQSDLNKFIDNGYRPLRVPMQPNYPAEQSAPQTHAAAAHHPSTPAHQTPHHPHNEHSQHPHHQA